MKQQLKEAMETQQTNLVYVDYRNICEQTKIFLKPAVKKSMFGNNYDIFFAF